MSDQTRAIIAAALALIVILLFDRFYKFQSPGPSAPSAVTSPIGAGSGAASGPLPGTAPGAAAAKPSSVAAPRTAAVAAAAEQAIVVESDLYRVEFSNRGATVHSWQLKKYNAGDPPHVLDLVNANNASSLDGWPFSVVLGNPTQEAAVNNGLFELRGAPASGGPIQAPANLTFVWSDGHFVVTKHFQFDDSYIVKVETSVQLDGSPIPHGISWRGGFGDANIVQRRGVTPTQVFYSQDGKITTLAANRLGQPKQPLTRATQAGPDDFAGIEDLYFAAAFLPPVDPSGQVAPADITLTDWSPERDTTSADGKTQKTLVPEMAAGTEALGPLDLRMYVGPKRIDDLRAARPPLNGLVQFGWLTVIAEPMFYALRWVDGFTHNYGWAIVFFSIALNLAFFPLKAMGMRAAQKMQRAGPEIKAIQEKYKKYPMRDPRRQEMNKEVMAVYSREGINPLGSCWPQLVQFPIWFAVYRMLEYTIELRQAPWFGWIHDLAAPDPYYVLPVLLGLTGFVMAAMTPTPGVDPGQARMMKFMPLAFGFIFIFYPSGLSLYIMGSYVVGIGQQYYLNKTSPLKPAKALAKGKKKQFAH